MGTLRNSAARILACLNRCKPAQQTPEGIAQEEAARRHAAMLQRVQVEEFEPEQARAALDQCADGKRQNLWRERTSGKVIRLPHPTDPDLLEYFLSMVTEGRPFSGQEKILADYDSYEMLVADGCLCDVKPEHGIYNPEGTENAEFVKGYRITQAGLNYRVRLHHPAREWIKAHRLAFTVAILSTVIGAAGVAVGITNLVQNW